MSRRKPSYLSLTDLFCGAGGASIGAEAAGLKLALGINHWARAVQTHALMPAEIQLGMAFVAEYVVTGNQREKVKQLGQAVTPPVPAFIWQRIVESLR